MPQLAALMVTSAGARATQTHMAERGHIPEELRVRVQRQRRRQRFVRISFAATIAVTVLLLFGINQAQNLAPTARTLFVKPTAEAIWMLDLHLDYNNQGTLNGSFAIVRVKDDDAESGTRYDGTVNAVTLAGDESLGVTAGPRFLEFDLTEEGWPRKRIVNLGLTEPDAGSAVLHSGGEYWACWTRGDAVLVRPLDKPAEPHSLHAINRDGAALGGMAVKDRIWLLVLDRRDEKATLVSFVPGVVETEDGPQTHLEVLSRIQIPHKLRRCSLAVIETEHGDQPVVAMQRKDEREWGLLVYDPQGRDWHEASLPARESEPSRLEIINFTSLSADQGRVFATYNDGRSVKLARGTLGRDTVTWDEPAVLPLDKTQGVTAYVVWVAVLCAVLLLMASQGVWLMLNRERPGDRNLAAMLERKLETDTARIAKPEPKLLYASAIARVAALLIDLAITSPIVILLQDVYEYSWEQAYGFFAFASAARLDETLLHSLAATAVTVLVLAIYGTVAELFWGKTFGKTLLRLRVVDRKGEHPAAWRVIVRNLLKVFELLHFLVLLVPMILMMLTGKQQRLGDIAGGTYVIVDALPEETPDDIDI